MAIATADRNAIIIFAGVTLALAAWKAIDWFPSAWRTGARLIAWAWAMIFIVASIYISL